jgi:hypothetical protein
MYDINTYRDSPVVSDPILHLSLHFDPLVVSRGLVECHDWPVVAPWIDVIITFLPIFSEQNGDYLKNQYYNLFCTISCIFSQQRQRI